VEKDGVNDNDQHEPGKAPKTQLGDAVEGLITTWNQLVSHIAADVGQVQPTIDHVKESAEYSVRQFKDACLEAGGEFTRVALEWRLSHPDETLLEVINLSRLTISINERKLRTSPTWRLPSNGRGYLFRV